MRKKHPYRLLSMLGATVLLLSGACFLYPYRNYYSISQEHPELTMHPSDDDTLRIAFIGDSWAYLHESHSCQIAQMLSDTLHTRVSVISAGENGATSKRIYDLLSFDSPLRKTLQTSPHYCVVSAGINDCNLKKGGDFYQEHMRLLADVLLQHQITPVFLEIPDYDIMGVYNRSGTLTRLRRRFSMLVTDSQKDCREQYRQALDDMLRKRNYTNRIVVLRKDLWNPLGVDDPRQLYLSDGIHLNERGYEILDAAIARVIAADYRQRQGFTST